MALADDVSHWIAAHKPLRVLALGGTQRFGLAPADGLTESDGRDFTNDNTIYDIALIDAERFCDADLAPLIARARDVSARALLLWLPSGRQLNAAALGLTLLRDYGAGALFGYDIATYKTPPDWLNANYWANPQMWDKKRW